MGGGGESMVTIKYAGRGNRFKNKIFLAIWGPFMAFCHLAQELADLSTEMRRRNTFSGPWQCWGWQNTEPSCNNRYQSCFAGRGNTLDDWRGFLNSIHIWLVIPHLFPASAAWGGAVSLGCPCGCERTPGAMEVATDAPCCEFLSSKIKI